MKKPFKIVNTNPPAKGKPQRMKRGYKKVRRK